MKTTNFTIHSFLLIILFSSVLPLYAQTNEEQSVQECVQGSAGEIYNLEDLFSIISPPKLPLQAPRDKMRIKYDRSACINPAFLQKWKTFLNPKKKVADSGPKFCAPNETLIAINIDTALLYLMDHDRKDAFTSMCQKVGFHKPIEATFADAELMGKMDDKVSSLDDINRSFLMSERQPKLADLILRLRKTGARVIGVSVRPGFIKKEDGNLVSIHEQYQEQLDKLGLDFGNSSMMIDGGSPLPLNLISTQILKDKNYPQAVWGRSDLTGLDEVTHEKVYASFLNGVLLTGQQNVAFSLKGLMDQLQMNDTRCVVFVDRFDDNLMDLSWAFSGPDSESVQVKKVLFPEYRLSQD
jgi:hypothetical protein